MQWEYSNVADVRACMCARACARVHAKVIIPQGGGLAGGTPPFSFFLFPFSFSFFLFWQKGPPPRFQTPPLRVV